jgi:hypothetical protein
MYAQSPRKGSVKFLFGGDLVDLHLRKRLTVAFLLVIAGLGLEAEDDLFVTFAFGDDGTGDGSARNGRLANRSLFGIGDQKHLIKSDLVSVVDELFDRDGLALFDDILLASGFDNGECHR